MSTHRTLLMAVAAGAALACTAGLLRSQSALRPSVPHDAASRSGIEPPPRRRTPTVDAVQRTRDATVNIHSERTAQGPATEELFALAPSQNRINGMGTGIVVDPRGYIVTNQHVVEDVQVIRVRLADGTLVSAHVLARDPESDLALLKIDLGRSLPVMPLGTSSDLMVGETVITVGNAYGYEHTASQGIVSAVGRDVMLNKDVQYKALIQTDACINPGNSGGPLLNTRGELVGVNVAIRAGAQCIGFAIPVDTMIRVTASLLAGRATRNGVAPHGLTVRDDVRRPDEEATFVRQVVVERVEAGSAAGKAGLQRGDVLIRVGDVRIGSSLDLERAFVEATPGDRFAVTVRRGGSEVQAELTLETRAAPAAVTGDAVWRRLGLKLQPIGAEGMTRNYPQLHGGLVITDVRPEGAAGKAGLQRGDVLIGLHQWEMLTLENVLFVVNHPDLQTFNPVRFYILRAGQVHRGSLQAE
jgi:serine protease Do